jgi:cytochrome c-type biogenesis protein
LGIPFLLTGFLIHKFFEYFKTIRKYFRVITLVGGILLVFIGLLLITGYFTTISSFLGA